MNIKGYVCERCKHIWKSRNNKEKPRVCPSCKSPYWDIPRKNKKATSKKLGTGRIKK